MNRNGQIASIVSILSRYDRKIVLENILQFSNKVENGKKQPKITQKSLKNGIELDSKTCQGYQKIFE